MTLRKAFGIAAAGAATLVKEIADRGEMPKSIGTALRMILLANDEMDLTEEQKLAAIGWSSVHVLCQIMICDELDATTRDKAAEVLVNFKSEAARAELSAPIDWSAN